MYRKDIIEKVGLRLGLEERKHVYISDAEQDELKEIGMTQIFLQKSNLAELAHAKGLDCRVMENKFEQGWNLVLFEH